MSYLLTQNQQTTLIRYYLYYLYYKLKNKKILLALF